MNRSYSDKEAAAIIERALELQSKADSSRSAIGLRIEELERIATEAGIRPELIRRAAEELGSSRSRSRGAFWLGGPTVLVEESDAPAATSEEMLSDLIAVVDDVVPGGGQSSIVAHALQWRSDSAESVRTGRSLRVSVKPVAGGMRIRVEERLSGVAGGLFGGLLGGLGLGAGIGVGFGVGMGALGSPLASVLISIGILVSTWLLARTIFKQVARRGARRARRMVELLREALTVGAGRRKQEK